MAHSRAGASSFLRKSQNSITVSRIPQADCYSFARETSGQPWVDPFVGRRQQSVLAWQEPTREMLIAPPKAVYVVTSSSGKRSVRMGRTLPPASFYEQVGENANTNDSSFKTHANRRPMRAVYHEIDDVLDEDLTEDTAMDDSAALEETLTITSEGEQLVAAVPNIPPAMFNYIVGKKGATKRNIELQTNTHLSIPTKEFQPDASKQRQVLIYGDNRQNIIKAFRAVQATAARVRKTMSPTHFVSVPITELSFGNTVERFLVFKQLVLEEFGVPCRLIESNFVDASKLHITICMAVLLTKEECDAAKKLFESVCRQKMVGYSFQVAIKGLDIMNDDPSACSIVYAKVQSANAMLQELAAAFTIALQRRNFFAGKKAEALNASGIKLHVTLMRARRKNAAPDDSDISEMENDEGEGAKLSDVIAPADEITDVPSGKSAAAEHDIMLSTIGVDPVTGKSKAVEKSSDATRSKKRRGRPVMDIGPVMKKYGDFDFGVTTVDTVHFSVRMTTDPKTRYYKNFAAYDLAADEKREDDTVPESSKADAAKSSLGGSVFAAAAGATTAAADLEEDDGGEEDAEDAEPDTVDDRDFFTFDDDGLECG